MASDELIHFAEKYGLPIEGDRAGGAVPEVLSATRMASSGIGPETISTTEAAGLCPGLAL